MILKMYNVRSSQPTCRDHLSSCMPPASCACEGPARWRLCSTFQRPLNAECCYTWPQPPGLVSSYSLSIFTSNFFVHSALSDDNKADVACSTAGMISTVTVGRPVGITQWTIISAPGTYHPPHFDASGYHTLVQVLDGGSKLWAFARRRPAPTPTPHPGSTETEWQWAAFDDCEVTLVALKVHDRA